MCNMGEPVKSINPYENVKWCVHLIGLDEIFAANSFKEACEKAAEGNELWSRGEIQEKMDQYSPVVWFKVEQWISPATGRTSNEGHQENRDRHNWEW